MLDGKRVCGVPGLTAVALVCAAGALGGQEPSGQPPARVPGWSVEPRASTDLWFHGLAVIGYRDGGGPFSLYDAEYVRRVREAKQQMGVYPTPLDTAGQELLDDMRSESRVQLFHFVPLYFARAGPQEMLAALSAVADNRARDSSIAGVDVRFGALAVARSLSRGRERRILERFVELLQAEWDQFYGRYWDVFWRERVAMVQEAQHLWEREFQIPLEPYLRRMSLEHGMIIPTPTLGFEGRIDEGDTYDPRDNTVAVRVPAVGVEPLPILYGAVRELCFPLLDVALRIELDDVEEIERLRSIGAVRCGALLLEFYAPAFVRGYWRWFLALAGDESAAVTAAAFRAAYPLSDAHVRDLRRALRQP